MGKKKKESSSSAPAGLRWVAMMFMFFVSFAGMIIFGAVLAVVPGSVLEEEPSNFAALVARLVGAVLVIGLGLTAGPVYRSIDQIDPPRRKG